MKTIQIESRWLCDGQWTNDLLKAAGVQRIHSGWYTVTYDGVALDESTIRRAKRNRNGEIQFPNQKKETAL
jgi:hypothetical protein